MKKRRGLSLVTIVVLILVACLAAFLLYRAKYTYVGEQRFEKKTELLDLSGTKPEALEELQVFTQLKKLDLRDTGLTCEEYDQVRSWFPETEILWDIPFQGSYYDMDTELLVLTTLSEEDLPVLDYFTKLRGIQAVNCPDYLVLDTLRQQKPQLELNYRIPVAGYTYSHQSDALVLPGESVEELFSMLPLFPELKTVELTEPLAPIDRILALREAFPDVTISWSLDLKGIRVDEFTETLDLTGIPMTVEELEAALPYLLNLSFVDMTDCGISNEEMDALNARHENVKIVWTVILGGWYRIRTDATTFMPVKDDFYPSGGTSLYNLRYCHDIIAIDLGHRKITSIDFVAYMPHLKYLIIADTNVRDLTPLTGLSELVYLEMFITAPYDLSPLVTLTALEDLNLSYTRGDPSIIAQITWLKNLQWNHIDKFKLTWEQQQMLREAIPDCYFDFTTASSTGGKWRTLPNYYAQRDAFGLHYMTG